MRLLPVLLASVVVAGAGAAISAAPATASTPGVTPHATAAQAGTFVALTPFRAANTVTGLGGHRGAVTAHHGFAVRIGGRGGVPAGVAAVAVTLTAVSPTASGALVAYPAGARRPGTTALSFPARRTTSASAVSRLSGAGALEVDNVSSSGSTQIVVDVSGYYVAGAASTSDPGVFHALSAPARVYDSRSTGDVYVAHGVRTGITLGGHAGVPTSGVGAVVATVTAVSPTGTGGLTIYAHGNDRPALSAASFLAHEQGSSFVVVPTDSAGRVDVYNASAGTVQVIIDVVGWTNAGVSRTAGTVQPRFPARVVNGVSVPAGGTRTVAVAGAGGVPRSSVSAVLARLAVSRPAAAGGFTVWRGGTAAPTVTDLQFAAGRSTANLAVLPLSSSGTVAIRNTSSRAVALYVDVVGFVPANTITPPTTSVSHYIRQFKRTDSTATIGDAMGQLGCDDAKAGSTLAVLEFGAQSITTPQLSKANPGVLQTTTNERLTYDQVVAAVNGYRTGAAGCVAAVKMTIAVGTNNAGAYDKDANAYDPKLRGADWANRVVGPLRTAATDNFTIVGANDVEASFDTSPDAVQHVKDWETAYFNANSNVALYFNGSLDNCPDTFGVVNTSCTPGWTQDQYYSLAYGYHPYRMKALPQVYTVSQATQWVNIDSSGGNKMVFAGALTENASCPAADPAAGCPTASYTGPNGWAALVRGLATLPGSHTVPEVSDLRIDS